MSYPKIWFQLPVRQKDSNFLSTPILYGEYLHYDTGRMLGISVQHLCFLLAAGWVTIGINIEFYVLMMFNVHQYEANIKQQM